MSKPITIDETSHLTHNRLARFENYDEFIGKKVFASAITSSTAGAFVVLATALIDLYYLAMQDPFWTMMGVRLIAAFLLFLIYYCLKTNTFKGYEIICINALGSLSATILMYGYSVVFPNYDYLPFVLIYYMFATTVIAPMLSFSGFIIPYLYLVSVALILLIFANAPIRMIENFIVFSIPTLTFLWILIITQRKISVDAYNYAYQSYLNATLDSLSNLLNRRAWYAQAQLRWNEAQRHHTPLVFIMIDIDNFKQVNDTCGHAYGDKVIQAISQLLISETRDYDIIGRLGGEEFGVLLPQTDREKGLAIAERIRIAVEEQIIKCSQNSVKTTISAGLAQSVPTIETIDALIMKGDELLYKAKNSGRNRICFE